MTLLVVSTPPGGRGRDLAAHALTQIQGMTLVFVPKILAIFVAMLIALSFMAFGLPGHMIRLAARVSPPGD